MHEEGTNSMPVIEYTLRLYIALSLCITMNVCVCMCVYHNCRISFILLNNKQMN